MANIPFGTTDWSAIERTVHAGETGTATWRTKSFDGIRVRMVEYSPGYRADHWCKRASSTRSSRTCARSHCVRG
jgi:hypothetical protein